MKFIAEIGWNFIGDMALAKRMVVAAKEAGADYAKFQVWDPKSLKPGPWDKDGRREIYEKAFLDDGRIKELHEMCRQVGLGFFVSVFELDSLRRVANISTEVIKIPSHECVNWPLIDLALETFNEVFLSVGALDEMQLNELIERYQKYENLVVLHCVSSYPLEIDRVNLPKLKFLREKFSTVGYSSHFTGTIDAILACTLGADYVEKHFTVDNNLPGRDNKFALLPDAFKSMIADAELARAAMVDCGLGMQDCEADVATVMRGRWSKGVS